MTEKQTLIELGFDEEVVTALNDAMLKMAQENGVQFSFEDDLDGRITVIIDRKTVGWIDYSPGLEYHFTIKDEGGYGYFLRFGRHSYSLEYDTGPTGVHKATAPEGQLSNIYQLAWIFNQMAGHAPKRR